MSLINLKNVIILLSDEFKISKICDTPIKDEEIKLKNHLQSKLDCFINFNIIKNYYVNFTDFINEFMLSHEMYVDLEDDLVFNEDEFNSDTSSIDYDDFEDKDACVDPHLPNLQYKQSYSVLAEKQIFSNS